MALTLENHDGSFDFGTPSAPKEVYFLGDAKLPGMRPRRGSRRRTKSENLIKRRRSLSTRASRHPVKDSTASCCGSLALLCRSRSVDQGGRQPETWAKRRAEVSLDNLAASPITAAPGSAVNALNRGGTTPSDPATGCRTRNVATEKWRSSDDTLELQSRSSLTVTKRRSVKNPK